MTGEEPRARLGRDGLETAEHRRVEDLPPARAAHRATTDPRLSTRVPTRLPPVPVMCPMLHETREKGVA
ncbi:hypothetical protein ACWCQQ_29655 [Streptomyces sp. NPDC002143]